jgi:hypothetical protein
MMSLRFAPMALRTPISRVRSVTDTSMIFITPMPPTIRPTDEIATIAIAETARNRTEVIENTFRRLHPEIIVLPQTALAGVRAACRAPGLGLVHHAGTRDCQNVDVVRHSVLVSARP